jgi:hypothetical protein
MKKKLFQFWGRDSKTDNGRFVIIAASDSPESATQSARFHLAMRNRHDLLDKMMGPEPYKPKEPDIIYSDVEARRYDG